MRPLGFTLPALLVLAATAFAQQPVAPAVPTAVPSAVPQVPPGTQVQPIVPVGSPVANPLDMHLARWEQTMGSLVNFRVEIELTRKDAVFNKERKYKGVVLCMKPNYAILRLDNIGDPTKTDYEAYICNGASVYQYNGLQKTMTEWKLPPRSPNAGTGTDNLMLDFLSGLKAADAKQRFDLSLHKEDVNYVYLGIKPLLPKDKQEFQQLKMALYGPNTKQLAYLPRQVFKVNPNGDSELWDFINPTTNLRGIDASVFQYKKVPGFTEQQAPNQAQPQPQPPGLRPGQPMLPGANGLPPGTGTVRP